MNDCMFISQRKYATELLNKFGMAHCKPTSVPMNATDKLMVDDCEVMKEPKQFRCLVGGLIYLTHTRPDIAFGVTGLKVYTEALNNSFRGRKKNAKVYSYALEFCLWYGKGKHIRLEGYIDSELSGPTKNHKSISANVFSVGSSAVTWSSRKHKSWRYPRLKMNSLQPMLLLVKQFGYENC
jgi:hypothetical protein